MDIVTALILGFSLLIGIILTIWLISSINQMKQSLQNINTLLLHIANKLYDNDEAADGAEETAPHRYQTDAGNKQTTAKPPSFDGALRFPLAFFQEVGYTIIVICRKRRRLYGKAQPLQKNLSRAGIRQICPLRRIRR